MVNKKLMTSLFDVKFVLKHPDNPSWVFYWDDGTTPITQPVDQHKYLNDKVSLPSNWRFDDANNSWTTIYCGPSSTTLRKWKVRWSRNGVAGNPWNFNSNLVDEDVTLKLIDWQEQKRTISFVRIETNYKNTQNKLKLIPGFQYEALPTSFEVSNSSIVPNQGTTGTYGSDYTKNSFYYNNDGLEHRCVRYQWKDQHGYDFNFGSTPVHEDKILHMTWEFKKWNFIVDYNIGSGKYYNDLVSNPTIDGVEYDKAGPATKSYLIEDNFSLNTSPSGLGSILGSLTSTFKATVISATGETLETDVKILGWYTTKDRSTAYDKATCIQSNNQSAFAKWGNNSAKSFYRYTTGPSYSDWSRTTDVWTANSGTFVVPSFMNKFTGYALGAGGGSKSTYMRNCDGAEVIKVCITTPGGDATLNSKECSNASKKSFSFYALGTEGNTNATSYIKESNGIWEVSSARGASGGGDDTGTWYRYDLLDHESEEMAIAYGAYNIRSYFGLGTGYAGSNTPYPNPTQAGSSISTRYAGNVPQTNGVNSTYFYFKGVRSSTEWAPHGKSEMKIYFYPEFMSNGSWAYRPDGVHVATATGDEETGGGNNNEYQYYSFSISKIGSIETKYIWQGRSDEWGKGGQCIFISNQSSGMPKDDNWNRRRCHCYGKGGYVMFHFPKE